mgnify:CR=1 FL=1
MKATPAQPSATVAKGGRSAGSSMRRRTHQTLNEFRMGVMTSETVATKVTIRTGWGKATMHAAAMVAVTSRKTQ